MLEHPLWLITSRSWRPRWTPGLPAGVSKKGCVLPHPAAILQSRSLFWMLQAEVLKSLWPWILFREFLMFLWTSICQVVLTLYNPCPYFFTLGRHRRQQVLSSVIAFGWPAICPSVRVSVQPSVAIFSVFHWTLKLSVIGFLDQVWGTTLPL